MHAPAAAVPAASVTSAAPVASAASAISATADPRIQAIAEQARSAFLSTQPFKRLNLAVWVQAAPGEPWRGGEVDATAQVYPASMVKLPFGIDSVLTCVERGAAPACQQDDLVPMLVDSDNVATGRLIDGLTATRNLQDSPVPENVQASPAPENPAERDAAYAAWFAARRHTERRLEALGLLGGMRLFTKTYPTNSGEEPVGFEQRARQELGRNSMSAHAAAALLRALVDGEIDSQSGVPVLATLGPYLTRNRFSLQSALASGAPPGTRVLGKMGSAYDTLEEVAVLSWPADPRKPRVLIAAFSDGLDPETPEPFDGWRLAGLTTELLTRLHLMPQPRWQAPAAHRGAIARWVLPANAAARTVEVQYRFGNKARIGAANDTSIGTANATSVSTANATSVATANLRRVHLRCSPGCSSNATTWTWPAARVTARPLLLGEVQVPAGATVEVEAELESATADPGVVQWLVP